MDLSSAYILGGSPCSGKSTMAEMLAAQFDLPYYKVDDHERAHARRATPERHPVITNILAMSGDENWMRPVAQQVEDEFAFYRERFELILEDLVALDWRGPYILEGAAYLPELINLHGARKERVLFMIPSKEFQVTHYSQRPWIKIILNQCTDPDQAFANWMERDHLFGQGILRQAEAFGYRTMIVNGRRGIEEQFSTVKQILGLTA